MRSARRRRPGLMSTVVAPPNLGGKTKPEAVARAVDELAVAVNRIGGMGDPFVEVDLAIGANNVSHALGRTPRGVFPVFQTSAVGVTYDWRQLDNPHPDRIAVVVSDGVARVRLVFF